VWSVDHDLAAFHIGETYDPQTALEAHGDKIHVFDDGRKWWLKEFIPFQQGDLRTGNKPHEAIIALLEKHSLTIVYQETYQTSQVISYNSNGNSNGKSKTPEAEPLASALIKSIQSWKPDLLEIQKGKIDKTRERWAEDIDKAIRLDKRDAKAMEAVIKWLPKHDGGNGFRWRNQILCGSKLREKFDRLEIAMGKTQRKRSKF
jgi:hypothetical protein